MPGLENGTTFVPPFCAGIPPERRPGFFGRDFSMRIAATLTLSFLSFACGRNGLELPGPGPSEESLVAGHAWSPGQGFVVHEWGTLTSVMASDGSLLPGLHHEEEDLPGFVADRMAQARETPSVVQKMETPVTYFYSAERRTVSAAVDFPRGVFTQWFPYVK